MQKLTTTTKKPKNSRQVEESWLAKRLSYKSIKKATNGSSGKL